MSTPLSDLIVAGRNLVDVRLRILQGEIPEHSAGAAEARAWDQFNLAMDAAESARTARAEYGLRPEDGDVVLGPMEEHEVDQAMLEHGGTAVYRAAITWPTEHTDWEDA